MGENSKKWAKRLAYATAVPAVGIFGLAVALGVANRTGLTNEDSAVSEAEQSAPFLATAIHLGYPSTKFVPPAAPKPAHCCLDV